MPWLQTFAQLSLTAAWDADLPIDTAGGKTLIVSERPQDEGRIERFMLWADDEFGFDFTWLLIILALAALGGLVFLASWLF